MSESTLQGAGAAPYTGGNLYASGLLSLPKRKWARHETHFGHNREKKGATKTPSLRAKFHSCRTRARDSHLPLSKGLDAQNPS